MSARASASALARSGRLLITSNASLGVIREPRCPLSAAGGRSLYAFEYARIPQSNVEDLLQAPIHQPPRLAHEREEHRWKPRLGVGARDARRAREAVAVGDEIEVVAHLELGVVARVVDPRRRVELQGPDADRREIVGVDVVRTAVRVGARHRRCFRASLERQAIWGVDARNAQDHELAVSCRTPSLQHLLGVDAAPRALRLRREGPRLVDSGAAAVAVHAARAEIHDPAW